MNERAKTSSESMKQDEQDIVVAIILPRKQLVIVTDLRKKVLLVPREELPENSDILSISEELLANYRKVLKTPELSELEPTRKESSTNVNAVEVFRERLMQRINETYREHAGSKDDETLERKLRFLLVNKLLPHMRLKNDNFVFFSAGIMKELNINMPLKHMAKRLGWQYRVVWVDGTVHKGMIVPMETLIKFLSS